jgi:Brp/Blh family beta-carotene 15,15'-monooxygenase
MKNYTKIAIVTSFFGLWLDSFLSTKYQIISGFLLIFTFGILHGANDLLLIKNINAKKHSNSSLKTFRNYIIVVLSGILLFYAIPQFALLLFIVVSAHHFGEQQWQNLQDDFPKWFVLGFQFFYGLVILLLLFNFHTVEVQNNIFNIANMTIPIPFFWLYLKVSGIIFIGLSAYVYWKLEKIRKKLLLEFFFLVVFTIIFKSSSLIWGFAIYFVIWHSITSIIDQIKFLNGSFSIPYFIAYCRSAAIYWIISIIGIALIYFVFKGEHLFNALFFSFLAAITFPHAIVITRMFRGKKSKLINRNE